MSDLHLLVPINIEALVVGENTGDEWANLKPDFRGIYSYNYVLGSQLENPAFSPVTGLNEHGVHLHWALPDGLTHGIAEEEIDIPDFPLIPNRWLVVRFWDQSKSAQPDLNSRAWIIESDTITDDEDANTWPWLDSEKLEQPSKDPADYSVFIGKSCNLNEWQGESNEPRVKKITAVGYGDPSFAAYYPACKGILGFHDCDFDGVDKDAKLTYMVVGWYSEPSMDPLWNAMSDKKPVDRIASLAGFLEKARWTYPDFQSLQEKQEKAKDSNTDITGLANQIPTAILCHGLIEGVQWDKTDNGVPLGKPFHIAVADTAVDALAALFAKEKGKESDDNSLAKLLAIFQYDLMAELEKPGGDSLVEAKIHERSFRPLSRGIRWDLLQDKYAATGSTEGGSPPIPGDIRLLLEKLNALQREINCKKRDKESLQSEIYAAWYKKVLTALQKHNTEELSTRITKLQAEVSVYSNEIKAFEKTSASQQNEIEEKLEVFLPGWKLKQFDEPEFRRPNDPVVLLAGDAFKRSARHGEDGRFRDDGLLLCRLSGKEITGIKIKVPYTDQAVTFIPDDPAAPKESDELDDYWRRPFEAVAKIPDDFHQDVFDLLREALLLTLDKRRARHIIRNIYKKIDPDTNHTEDIHKLSAGLLDPYLSQLWESASDPKSNDFHLRHIYEYGNTETEWGVELVGQFPSPVIKNSRAENQNPWLPLFLQWRVCWIPDSTDTQNALKKWELNPNDHDFVRKDGEPEDDKGQTTYTGTSILTPGVGLHLSERLRQYNLRHENEPLRTLQTEINSMQVLCQSLGGFTDQLLMRKSYLELPPLEPSEDDDFGPKSSDTIINEAVKDIDWISPMTEGTFLPLRAGCLKIEKLWVIDAFGQFLRLVDEDHGASLKEIFSRRQCGSDGMIRLQPRLAQPARLSMQWIPAEDKVYKDEDFNPVCGWILPNFLDKSLMIYDAGGYALGALQVVQKKSSSKGAGGVHEEIESFHWIDIPGSRDIFFGTSPKEIKNPLPEEANPHLRGFVMGLLPLSEGCGQRFSDLLNSMSEVLAYSSAGDAVRNQNLALLIGKPFALVQASLCLEVDGRLATSPDGLTGGIENLRFPLHLGNPGKGKDLWLGDDGLAGFFLDNKYDKFHPVFRLTENGDSYNIYDDSPLQISISAPLKLTLLMDPARGISVTSGILPRTVFPFPYHDLVETMENKQVVFFSGPVLNPVSNEGIRMPRPSDIYGQWSWTHHPEVMTWGEAAIGDVEQEQNVFPDPPPRIVEGWLKLVTAPLEVRAFTVTGKNPVDKTGEKAEPSTPPCFQVSADKNTITLSWSVIGAEKIELWMKKKEENIRLFQSQSHPLPAQYTIKVDGNTLFTLFAFGRKEFSTDKKEPEPATKSIKVIVI